MTDFKKVVIDDPYFPDVNIGLDEYRRVVNLIEKYDKEVNQHPIPHEILQEKVLKRILRALIHLLEFSNRQVKFQEISRNEAYELQAKSKIQEIGFDPYDVSFLAITNQNKYFCTICSDEPESFRIISLDGKRKLSNCYNWHSKDDLEILLDNQWYLERYKAIRQALNRFKEKMCDQ